MSAEELESVLEGYMDDQAYRIGKILTDTEMAKELIKRGLSVDLVELGLATDVGTGLLLPKIPKGYEPVFYQTVDPETGEALGERRFIGLVRVLNDSSQQKE